MKARRSIGFVLLGALGFVVLFCGTAFASGGGDHWSLYSYLPFMENLRHLWGKTWLEGSEYPDRTAHVIAGVLTFVLAIGLTSSVAKRLARKDEESYLPEKTFGFFTFWELVAEGLLGVMNDAMGKEKARFFFPIIMSFAVFILISNLLGLVPGFLPATDNFNTTLALALIPFGLTHYYGVREHGAGKYFAHFLGPIHKWYALPLMALMLVIEIISHLARPLSLAIRLMGNMFGDHAVLSAFMAFGLIFVPLPVMALGLIVCIVQTVVFCLLSVVYIAMAVEHSEDH